MALWMHDLHVQLATIGTVAALYTTPRRTSQNRAIKVF